MGYTKNIAVIKGVQGGFSADGGNLSGLVKAERYARDLKVELSLINFAPLAEGRYVAAISDGAHTEIIEGGAFEGRSDVNTDSGFAAAVFYINYEVKLIATAVCGNFGGALAGLKSAVERAEGKIKKAAPYEDEAIAEENYYEFKPPYEGGKPVCENKEEKAVGSGICPNETGFNARKKPAEKLPQGVFYDKMRGEIEEIFATFPPFEELCAAVDGSKWAKISYGDDSFYVFGVIYLNGAKYICYGIPAKDSVAPPASMRGLASFLPLETEYGVGFWVMYQDAQTGESIAISSP